MKAGKGNKINKIKKLESEGDYFKAAKMCAENGDYEKAIKLNMQDMYENKKSYDPKRCKFAIEIAKKTGFYEDVIVSFATVERYDLASRLCFENNDPERGNMYALRHTYK